MREGSPVLDDNDGEFQISPYMHRQRSSKEAMMGEKRMRSMDSGTWMGIPAHLLKTAPLKTADPHHLR
jgi:hypothetical protein